MKTAVIKNRLIWSGVMLAAIAGTVNAQSQARASIVGGGNPYEGKCTVEVVVDGAAEVEIRGDTANLHNLSGQPAQWRRFECSSAMPANPANFRFAGVDGRGRQELVRDPRQGGSAVVRIEDRDGGREGYTFDIFWSGGNGFGGGGEGVGPFNDRGFDDRRFNDRGFNDRGFYERRDGSRFTREQALRVCQDAIMEQAREQFGRRRYSLRDVRLDDRPGRRDWVMGFLDVRGRFGRIETHRFSCSVDFETGRVRTAQLDQFSQEYYPR